jgi:hypothetical protein
MAGAALASGLCIAAAIVIRGLATVSRIARPAAPAARPLLNVNPHAPAQEVGLTKFEAEDRLDWLEAHGRDGKVSLLPGEEFKIS